MTDSALAIDPEAFETEARLDRDSRVRASNARAVTSGVAVLVVFLVGWWLTWRFELVNPLFISNPIAVGESLIDLLSTARYWTDIWATFYASVLALTVGSVLGILTGIIFAASPAIRRGLNPYLAIINGIPRPALAPIFILWFGLGAAPKVLVGASIVYFVLLLNTLAGMTSIDDDIVTLSDSLGMNRWQKFWMIQLPGSLPSIVAGLRLGAVYSVLGVVVTEIVASYSGLGQLMLRFTNQLDIAASLAVVVLMSTMAVILDSAVRFFQVRMERE